MELLTYRFECGDDCADEIRALSDGDVAECVSCCDEMVSASCLNPGGAETALLADNCFRQTIVSVPLPP